MVQQQVAEDQRTQARKLREKNGGDKNWDAIEEGSHGASSIVMAVAANSEVRVACGMAVIAGMLRQYRYCCQ